MKILTEIRPARFWARNRSSRSRRTLLVLTALAALTCVVAYRPLFLGNFGVVDPGVVYRSAQPKRNVVELLGEHGIATVLNMRGGSIADPWYVEEVRATRVLGVDFYDLPMSATRRPSRRELLTLIDLFDRCRYPLLIHCKSGADRTGLAAGLYLMLERNRPPDEAIGQFTLAHGHVPLFGPERLHEPFREYAAWLARERLEHDPARFRGWVERVYRSDDTLAEYAPPRPGPRVRR